MLTINGVAWGISLGILSARFRDIPQLITNVMQVLLYVTPLLWDASSLGPRAWIAGLNPFTYLIQIVRGPLLGVSPYGFRLGGG